MEPNNTPTPSPGQRNALLLGWGFVVGMAALALPARIAQIVSGIA